jgi:hypothetical protein
MFIFSSSLVDEKMNRVKYRSFFPAGSGSLLRDLGAPPLPETLCAGFPALLAECLGGGVFAIVLDAIF